MSDKWISYSEFKDQLDRIEGYTERLNQTIHGNGNPGMKTELSNTIIRVNNLENEKDVGRGTVVTFIVLAITCATAIAAAIIQ